MHARLTLRRTRPLLLVAALLAALLGLAAQSAAPAHAAAADRWGFAFLDNPTPPPGYVPDPSRQWGSWTSPSTNPVTVDQTGLGQYVVHFPLIGGSGGIAHTTAAGSSGDWCQLTTWGVNSTGGEDVGVDCYNPAGSPDNSMFSVAFTGPPTTAASGGFAYVYSDLSGTLLASYNSTGAANSVGKSGTGTWKVFIPSLGGATPAGEFQATAVDPAQGARCKIANWSPGATGQTAIVQCYNSTNTLYDTSWTLSYAVQRALYGRVFPPKSFGYVWLNGGSTAALSYNSTGAANSVAPAGPGFVVNMPNIGNTPDDAQVTAYGPSPSWCGLTAPWTRVSGVATVGVSCYNPGGAPFPGSFFAAYSSAV